MKKGVIMSLSLILLLISGVVFAQPSIKSVETITIDNFDSVGEQNYQRSGVAYNWTWGVQASRFVAENYPKLEYFEAIPNSLRVLKKEGDPEPKVLGVKTAFNRKGNNWIEIYPTSSETDENGNPKAYEVPFIGVVSQIDVWVWGANYAYYLEILVRDADGRVHVIPAGSLAFYGWRNLIINIPTYIRQQSKLRSGPESMNFVGFRIRTDVDEYVDDYVVYFDQLKYVTCTLANIYDGYELRKVPFPGEDGAEGGDNGGNSNGNSGNGNNANNANTNQ